jgi:hypothetical protein
MFEVEGVYLKGSMMQFRGLPLSDIRSKIKLGLSKKLKIVSLSFETGS